MRVIKNKNKKIKKSLKLFFIFVLFLFLNLYISRRINFASQRRPIMTLGACKTDHLPSRKVKVGPVSERKTSMPGWPESMEDKLSTSRFVASADTSFTHCPSLAWLAGWRFEVDRFSFTYNVANLSSFPKAETNYLLI